MTNADLRELGFGLYGLEEDDPFYRIVFTTRKFGIDSLSGNLDRETGKFWLFGNGEKYTDKNELKKVLDVVGGEPMVIPFFDRDYEEIR